MKPSLKAEPSPLGTDPAKLHRALYGHRARTNDPRAILERVEFQRAGVQPYLVIPEQTVYLEPDAPHIGRWQEAEDGSPTGDLWIEPSESTGSRTVDFLSTASFRGRVPYRGGNKALVGESMIEMRVAKLFQIDHRIVDIRDQWPVVKYVNEAGVLSETTFDFWVLFKNLMSVAVSVKRADAVRRTRVLEKLKLVADQGVGGFADHVALVTDAFASLDRDYNASWILRARRAFNQHEYDSALRAIDTIHSSVRFHDLLQDAPSHSGRRTAIWNLIDHGRLIPDEEGRVTDLSMLHRTVFTGDAR